MGCLTSSNFVVLINGTPSKFFAATRGIREGFPLSPLLFIPVIEGLNLLIADARDHGLIKGIKISSSLALTHLLFVDDVILLGSGRLSEWIAFDVILISYLNVIHSPITSIDLNPKDKNKWKAWSIYIFQTTLIVWDNLFVKQ